MEAGQTNSAAKHAHQLWKQMVTCQSEGSTTSQLHFVLSNFFLKKIVILFYSLESLSESASYLLGSSDDDLTHVMRM